MKKLIWLTVIFVLFLVFVVPAVLGLGLKMIPNNIQPGYDPNIRLSIYSDRVFGQYFLSEVNNLTAIGMSVRNPNLKNKSEIFFRLYEGSDLLREVILNGQNIEDGSFIKFTFPAIPDSMGKNYYFTLSTPAAGAEETIEVFILTKPDQVSGITDYSYMDETFPGGTPIVTFSLPDSRTQTVKSIYSNWLSRLLQLHS